MKAGLLTLAMLGFLASSSVVFANETRNFSPFDFRQPDRLNGAKFAQTNCLPGLKKCSGSGPGSPFVCCKQSDTCAQNNGQPYCK
jgi:hypothetical protein